MEWVAELNWNRWPNSLESRNPQAPVILSSRRTSTCDRNFHLRLRKVESVEGSFVALTVLSSFNCLLQKRRNVPNRGAVAYLSPRLDRSVRSYRGSSSRHASNPGSGLCQFPANGRESSLSQPRRWYVRKSRLLRFDQPNRTSLKDCDSP